MCKSAFCHRFSGLIPRGDTLPPCIYSQDCLFLIDKRQRGVNALLVMQLKSVKPQTPALFQMLISLWLLSHSLPGVETFVRGGCFFMPPLSLSSFSFSRPSIINPALHVYLDVTPCLAFCQAGGLFATELPSSPQSHRPGFSFIRCVFSPPFPVFLCVALAESKQRFYHSEAYQAASTAVSSEWLHKTLSSVNGE